MIKTKLRLELRHYALRDPIEKNTAEGRWIKAREIHEAMPYYYPWDGKSDFHGSVETNIGSDVRFINKTEIFQKPIVSSKRYGYRLPTKAEFDTYIESRRKEALGMLKRTYDLERRASLDGQCKIRFQEEPNGRSFYQIFVG